MILLILFSILDSFKTRVLFDVVGPNGELGIRKTPFPFELLFIIVAGVVIIVLVVVAVKILMRVRKNKISKID